MSSSDLIKPLYFWSASDKETGIFSQWYRASFVDADGHRFDFMETYMMYQKAKLFGDEESAQQIMRCSNPRAVKAMGRGVKNFDEKVWKKRCEQIVYKGNMMKFEQNKDLMQRLLSTGERILVEASPFDNIWGVGFSPETADANKDRWGLNLLGKQLMKVRKTLSSRETGNK